jgi:hypothetical protein
MEKPENFFTQSTDYTLVILESPYSGDIQANMDYLDCCMHDCKMRGEGALATHLLYTKTPFYGHAADSPPDGMTAGRVWCCKLGTEGWRKIASKAVFYMDRGMSRGMQDALTYYRSIDFPVEFRKFNLTNQDLEYHYKVEKVPPPLADIIANPFPNMG